MHYLQKKLDAQLMPDETLLWCGTPTQTKLKTCPDRSSMYFKWAAFALYLTLTSVFFLTYGVANMTRDVVVVCFLCVNFIPFIIAWNPISAQKTLEHDTLFAITDRRILALIKCDVFSLERDESLRWNTRVWDGDYGNLAFNAGTARSLKQSRADAALGVKDKDLNLSGLVFYHIEKPDEVAALLA